MAVQAFEPQRMQIGVLTAALQELTPRDVRDRDPDRAIEDWLAFAAELDADCIQLSAALHPSQADVPAEALLDPGVGIGEGAEREVRSGGHRRELRPQLVDHPSRIHPWSGAALRPRDAVGAPQVAALVRVDAPAAALGDLVDERQLGDSSHGERRRVDPHAGVSARRGSRKEGWFSSGGGDGRTHETWSRWPRRRYSPR